jgi:NAD(P)-dependent dehydrogenase (short-subunit alcohol dehydrogenase family)
MCLPQSSPASVRTSRPRRSDPDPLKLVGQYRSLRLAHSSTAMDRSTHPPRAQYAIMSVFSRPRRANRVDRVPKPNTEGKMGTRLANKIAIVTGAGSGMGKAMAEMFTAEGAKVLCTDISGKEEEIAAALGGAALALHVDVAKEEDVRNMISFAEKRFGRVDILCNNAGFGGGMAPLHEQTTENWDRIHATNLRGVFFGMKYGVMSMLKSGGGAIVNTTSASGVVGWKHHSIYGAAKAGVNQLTKSAALDYAHNKIRINAVAPGTVWTGLVKASQQHAEPPPGYFRLPGIPLDRWGLPREIAAAALFLASDEASYITGHILPVDGGYCIGFSGMGAERPGDPDVNS